MDAEMTAILTGLMPLLESMVALGIPGVLLGVAAIPALVIGLMCWLNFRHEKQITKLLEAYRSDTQELLGKFSEMHQEAMREFSEKHAKVVNYYENNVKLVENHERMNDSLQTVVINNSRVMEHLSTIIEARLSQASWNQQPGH